MATENELIDKLITVLETSVEDINNSIPSIQKEIQKEIDGLLRELDVKGDTVKASVKNLRLIASFKDKITKIIYDSGYTDKVANFLLSFDEVAQIQNQYFGKVSKDFTPTKLLEEVRKQSISMTLDSLTEAGINTKFIAPINDILVRNSTTGGSWSALTNQLREYITNTPNNEGALQKYVKQVTTDSLNQYSAQYSQLVANDLGLEWYQYKGALIDTSRAFCVACIQKKYIHRSEFAEVVKGDFPQFKAEDGKINKKTGLPDGMIDGTDAMNFPVYRGGYNCGHQLVPVSHLSVPESIRNSIG
jgi:hypothetical protein